MRPRIHVMVGESACANGVSVPFMDLDVLRWARSQRARDRVKTIRALERALLDAIVATERTRRAEYSTTCPLRCALLDEESAYRAYLEAVL